MAKLQIRKVGDEVLRKVCRPVEEITPRILTLLDDMTETMRAADGCGLAAPQVGILRRIVVIEVEQGNVIELINPKIIATAGEQEGPEGCLSVPGRQGIVKRPKHVTVRATNRHGEVFEMSGSDLLARAFCHELDHLDGKLYIDRATYMED
ncbi:MAG: peptide deformylase [Clostridia bacterium]|nr:peptide deformylase [Clostridia bacterium]